MPRKPGKQYKFTHPIQFNYKNRNIKIRLPKKLLRHKNIGLAGTSIELWLGELKLLETQRMDGLISEKPYNAAKRHVIESLTRFLDAL